MARRSSPEVNAGSMADIAFLLLIFFLVTTTIETDSGISRKLPPMEESEEDVVIKQKNIFTELWNDINQNKDPQDSILIIASVEDVIMKCANEDYTLEINIENSDQLNSLTYIWTLDGVDVQTGSDNTYYLDELTEESGEFIVTVFDDITYCYSSTTINVNFYENSYCIDLPQGLSPNGDGFNDCLILDHLEDREDIDKIEVFNRYGTKIYELNEYIDQWCGTDQDGKIVPVGTYFYIIYFNSSKDPITSWIYVNY